MGHVCEVQVWHWIDSKWIVRFNKVCQSFASSGISGSSAFKPLPLFFNQFFVVFNAVKQFTDRILVWRPRMFASSRYSSMNWSRISGEVNDSAANCSR